MIVPPRRFEDWIRRCPPAFERFASHEFFHILACGTMTSETWKRFVHQELVYLPSFSAACSLLLSRDFDERDLALRAALGLAAQSAIQDMRGFEESAECDSIGDVRATRATRAYCNYLLRLATECDPCEAMAGLSVCMYSYPIVLARSLPRDKDGIFAIWWRSLSSPRVKITMDAWGVALDDRRFGENSCFALVEESLSREICFLDEVLC